MRFKNFACLYPEHFKQAHGQLYYIDSIYLVVGTLNIKQIICQTRKTGISRQKFSKKEDRRGGSVTK